MPEAIRRFNSGVEVSRAALAHLVAGGLGEQTLLAASPPERKDCFTRALAAPVFATQWPNPFGGSERRDFIVKTWKDLGFEPGPLDDAIVFHSGRVDYAIFYLLVHISLIRNEVLAVLELDEAEHIITEHIVTRSDMVSKDAFPDRWTNASGPWTDQMHLLEQFEAMSQANQYQAVVVTVKGKVKTKTIQVGVLPQPERWHCENAVRPFYVLGAEILRHSETMRFDRDTKEQTTNIRVLEKALGLESNDNALLCKDQTYGIHLKYDAYRGQQGADGLIKGENPEEKEQTFWFKTDTDAPLRLDPWMLCSIPEEGEKHYFLKEKIKVVFGTNDVVKIFDEYDRRLQLRVKASSFRPTPSKDSVPDQFPLSPETVTPLKADVLSPWEGAVVDLLQSSCVNIDVSRERHSMFSLKIPTPLEPFTNYELVIDSLPKIPHEGEIPDVVWRRLFTTGGFATIKEFATSFALAETHYRSVGKGKLQAIGNKFVGRAPQGAELDEAFADAGLEPLSVPKDPRIVVFWEVDAEHPEHPPEPAAVMIDASEPIWRSRAIPMEVTDDDPSAGKRYKLVPTEWLTLVDQTGKDTVVDRIVRAPGGQRALVTLKKDARGKNIRLALKQIAQKKEYLDDLNAVDKFEPVIDMIFMKAPWEED